MVAKIPPEVTIPLKEFCPENDSSDPASGQRQRPLSCNEGSGRNEQNDLVLNTNEDRMPSHCVVIKDKSCHAIGRYGLKLGKKNIVIITLIVILFVSLGSYIFSHAQIKPLEAEIEQLKAEIGQLKAMSTTTPLPTTSCPLGWILNGKLCYFFSDTENTWNSSHTSCSSYGASLIVMDSPEERTFINENKAHAEYWLGLRRKDVVGEPWKQPDGSNFDGRFEIKGEGPCASLNDGVVSSTDCDNHRRWICRKPLHSA